MQQYYNFTVFTMAMEVIIMVAKWVVGGEASGRAALTTHKGIHG